MNFFEKLYVGFQHQRFAQSEPNRILGFATPYEENAAGKKRMATVDGWSQKGISPKTIENKPVSGFKILGVHSRYSTDNKVFRVEDPRGFELEIYSDNLFEIILKHTVVNGLIVGDFLWGRKDGKNYLISSSSQEYKDHLSGPIKFDKATQVYFKNKAGNIIYKFIGKFYYNQLITEQNMISSNYSYYTQNRNRKYEYNLIGHVKRATDKLYVYAYYLVDEEGNVNEYRGYKQSLDLRKSELKNLIPITEAEIKDKKILDFVLPTETKINNETFSIGTSLANAWTSTFRLFNTKEESLSKNVYSDIDFNFKMDFEHTTIVSKTIVDGDYKK